MSPNAGTNLLPQPPRGWLFGVVAVLALVVIGAAYVQWQQYKLLDSAAHYQNDALGWSFSQLETEQLRLRNQLQRYLVDPQAPGADEVQMRYDIFVSRVSLVDHARAAGIMQDQLAYLPAMAQVRSFVKQADRLLGEKPEQALDAAGAQHLLNMLEALNLPLHDLSLGASHLLYQRATERNRDVRLQSQLGVALTVFQSLLLAVLAFIVLQQLRALTERRRHLEALAESLTTARQDADAANRAKSAFLANMSHEIRTPFHGMLGMMSLLQDGRLSPQQAVYLDTARESAQHLLTILNDILDISQLESGRLQVSPQIVDLPQLVGQVNALMHAQAQSKGLTLQVEVAPDVPRWVYADPTRVKQILFNLLNNAIKFTDKGTVSLALRRGPEGRLDFTVTDSGIGMDDAAVSLLFQRFTQGDASPSRRTSGTGLGLEISRNLARLMGGDITVRSAPGTGSAFTTSLPLATSAAPRLAAADPSVAAVDDERPLRVLVAEDHAVNRAYLEAVLEKLGHRGVFAPDGHSAVQAVLAQPAGEEFDIVLMDLHMPGMDGFTAARAIRALPAPRGSVPIVALTADAFPASRQLARDAGMDGFLTKPAHLPQLRETLRRYGGGSAPFGFEPNPPGINREHMGLLSSVLDFATVHDVSQALSSARYGHMLNDFFEGSAAAVHAMRRCAVAAEHVELRSRAHSLNGASASLGLHAVAAVARQLQVITPQTPLAELLLLLERLAQQFELSHAECLKAALLPGVALTPPAAPVRV